MPRSRDEIRESILDRLRAAYAPRRIVTTPKSFFWALAESLALEQEGADATAAAAPLEAFPESASDEGVVRHQVWSGLTRQPATRAVLRARVVGTPDATVEIADGDELASVEGLLFLAEPASLVLDGSGYGFISVVARDVGAAANLAAGAVLTWTSAPAGLTATATVMAAPGDTSSLLLAGAELESIESLRERVALWRKEKAQAGNRSDWVGWATSVSGVGSAYIYPRARRVSDGVGGYTWSYAVHGSLVLMPLAPAPGADTYVQNADGTMGLGLSPDFSRLPSELLRVYVGDYIDGTRDAAGAPVPEALQEQLRPATLAPGNYEIGAPTQTVMAVTLRITTDPAVAPWSWGFGAGETLHREITAATTTTLTLTDTTGITTGSRLAVFLGTSVVRGGWWVARVASPPVAGVVTLTAPLPLAPTAGAQKVRPDCGLWAEVRKRILAHADSLGTGDTQVPVSPYYPDRDVVQIMSARYPRPNDAGRDKVYASDLIALIESIPGVIGTALEDFTSPVSPTTGALIVPGEIKVLAG